MDRVTVIIRTLNESAMLGRVLEAVRAQRGVEAVPFVVDSGSSDGTQAIARAAGSRVEMLDRGFTFGGALNWAIERSDTSLIAFLSGHAVPASENWLSELVAPFADDKVAGVFGRQLPHPGCFVLEAEALQSAYPADGEGGPRGVRMSNANSAIRRRVWRDLRFDERVVGGEDAIWAAGAGARGYRVAYAPRASVFHSHDDDWRTRVRRTRREIGPLAVAFPSEYFSPLAELRAVAGIARSLVSDASRVIRGTLPLAVAARGITYRVAIGVGRILGLRDARRALSGAV